MKTATPPLENDGAAFSAEQDESTTQLSRTLGPRRQEARLSTRYKSNLGANVTLALPEISSKGVLLDINKKGGFGVFVEQDTPLLTVTPAALQSPFVLIRETNSSEVAIPVKLLEMKKFNSLQRGFRLAFLSESSYLDSSKQAGVRLRRQSERIPTSQELPFWIHGPGFSLECFLVNTSKTGGVGFHVAESYLGSCSLKALFGRLPVSIGVAPQEGPQFTMHIDVLRIDFRAKNPYFGGEIPGLYKNLKQRRKLKSEVYV